MESPAEKKTTPPPGSKWAPGAEPLALCMSCNATFPPEATECPNCLVGLSLVRKCPSCERIQSAQHLTCIYCANSFMQVEGLGVVAAGPLKQRRRDAEKRLRIMAAGAVAFVVVAGIVYFLVRRGFQKPPDPIALSYVLQSTSMRSGPSPDAPPIKDLEQAEIVQIIDYTHDSMGNRWFRIISKDLSGYVRTREVAPPKGLTPEKGFEALRHSLLGLDDPVLLGEATKAVENYRDTFPASPHIDEVRWLLAERTRDLAERGDRRLLAKAREQYEQLAQSGGEFAERARQALDQFPAPAPRAGPSRASSSAPLQFSIVGGSVASSAAPPPGTPHDPVRKLTILTRTPLAVRLTAPAELVPGASFEGEIAEDIRVKSEVAIPKGSRAHLTVTEGHASSGSSRAAPAPSLRMTALVIGNQTYGVSALAVRDRLPATLAAGTRLEFRLGTPLVVTQR